MNGCKNVQLDYVQGTLDIHCNTLNSDNRSVSSKYYLNLSKLVYNKGSGAGSYIYICKYDKNYNFISRERVEFIESGEHIVNLDPNYYTKFSINSGAITFFKGYQCNVGIGSMSNELAFGSVKFNDTLNVIIPFIIVLIGFVLGYSLLKKLIYKGNKGKTI